MALLEISSLDLYYGDAQALADVTLEVPEREIVAIVGANGVGKTSLIRTIAGIERARAGRITFKGIDITRLDSHRICDLGIGQVAEGRQIFPTLTVTENLEVGALLPRARARSGRAMEEAFTMFPHLAERSGQLAGTLSGGEQQMVAIGRALMTRPSLLMLDEPSLGLAPRVVELVLAVLGEINRAGVGVFLIEQNVRAALGLAHRAYVLEQGRVVGQGSSREILADPGVRRAYLGPLAVEP